MSAGIYTTTVDILGGAGTVDEWGDPVEGAEPLYSGVPARITERRQVVATESDAQAVTVHYYVGRLPAGTQVTADNRLREPAGDPDGRLYAIDYVRDTPGTVVAPDEVRLDLRRVT